MFRVERVTIKRFWDNFTASCVFNGDVSIIIGKNGTGKTTFMNILHAVLAVDLEGLADNNFESVLIELKNGSKKRTISVKRNEDPLRPFQQIEYKISTHKFNIRVFSAEDNRVPLHFKRKAAEESGTLREELKKLVNLSSLSVYRLRSGEDYEIKDRSGRRLVSSVDFRLGQLMDELTHYQLRLSLEARSISTKLQKDVLMSILYSEQKGSMRARMSEFDKEIEMNRLVSAYTQLGVLDSDVKKKISAHINSIGKSIESLKEKNTGMTDYGPIEAYIRTQDIIKMSLEAEEETKKIYSHKMLFISTLKDFINDKTFSLGDTNGELIIKNSLGQVITIEKLSSGEKQLLILLTEALLQNEKPFVYLADEPELSLHIAWQRQIIPAIKKLNKNSQIIAATHSPEVAANYKNSIINMKDIVV